MGVLCDYFFAADDATAIAVLDRLGPDDPATSAAREVTGLDAIELKGIEPAVVLGKLVAIVRGIEWKPNLASEGLLWTPDQSNGPWVTRMPDAARNTLAGIAFEDILELAQRWASIEEFRGAGDVDGYRTVIEQISGLARRAVNADHRIYAWLSL